MKSSILIQGMLLLCILINPLNAQTIEVSGTINTDTEWSADQVNVTGDLNIQGGATVTILPGTRVEMQGYYKIHVNGYIDARGREAEPIIFTINDPTGFSDTSTTSGSWAGIELVNNHDGIDTSFFKYCTIEYVSTPGGQYENTGSALYALNARVLLNHCTIRNNQGHFRGALRLRADHAVVKNSTIELNESFNYWGGGGIGCGRNDVVVDGNLIWKNIAHGHGGGGVLVEGGYRPLIINNRVVNNLCDDLGGGIFAYDDARPLIIQNIICNNQARAGAGISFQASGDVVINNVIANNLATYRGGAIHFDYPTVFEGVNNIMYGNTPDQINVASPSSYPRFTHCVIQDGAGGVSGESENIRLEHIYNVNPLFEGASTGAGVLYNGAVADWSIQEGSPCINAGSKDEFPQYLPGNDFEGKERVKFGEVDLGCYEFTSGVIYVNSNINSDQVWMADTVKIGAQIYVKANLTIAPGVVVAFRDNYRMYVEDYIYARGTEDAYIHFTAEDTLGFSTGDTDDGGWGPIYFHYNTNGSEFAYCKFQYGKTNQISEYTAPVLHAVGANQIIFDHCIFENNIGRNRGVVFFFVSSGIHFSSCTFRNNLLFSPLDYVSTIEFNNVSNVTIKNSTIINNQMNGIYSDKSGIYTGNLIANNHHGISLSGFLGKLNNNTIVNNSGRGIRFFMDEAEMNNNIIRGNLYSLQMNNDIILFANNNLVEGGINPPGSAEVHAFNTLDADPVFRKAIEEKGYGTQAFQADWSLYSISPCLNYGTGKLEDLDLMSVDMQGNPRIFGKGIDLGAFELPGSAPVITHHPRGGGFCAGEELSMSVAIEETDTVRVVWLKDGIDIPGENQLTLTVEDLESSYNGNYQCVVFNGFGEAFSYPAFVQVGNPPEILSQPESKWAIEDKSIRLQYGVAGSQPMEFQWYQNDMLLPNADRPELIFSVTGSEKEGKYYSTVTNECGTVSTDTVLVYLAPQICMVTVDTASGSNLVVWEKKSGAGFIGYRVYRESKAAGIYNEMETVSADALSVWTDTRANPMTQAYIYKITGIMPDGSETDLDLCIPHKTIHLLVSQNTETKTSQLSWDEYVGFDYGTYLIYRSNTGTDFEQVWSMSSSTSSWTDPAFFDQDVYYRVVVPKLDPCIATAGDKKAGSGPYSYSLSNVEDNRAAATGLDTDEHANDLVIYPNPARERVRISFPNPEMRDYRLTLTDLSGKVMLELNDIHEGTVLLHRGNLPAGVYILSLNGDRNYRAKLVLY